MTTTIRITCRNNADTRKFDVLGDLAKVKHNGGKLMIATLDDSDLAAVKELLEESRMVAGYEVTE